MLYWRHTNTKNTYEKGTEIKLTNKRKKHVKGRGTLRHYHVGEKYYFHLIVGLSTLLGLYLKMRSLKRVL